MKKTLFLALPLAYAFLFFIACQKQIDKSLFTDPEEETGTGENQQFFNDKTVSASFLGRVLNEEGVPMEGASVKAGGRAALTDEHGIFRFDSISVSEQFGFVKVEKQGYLTGSRTVATNTVTGNFVEIQMVKKILKGSFEAAAGASVSMADGTVVQFADHSIVTSSGSEYKGKVNVYGTVIDPSASNFAGIMPGDLRGIRTDNTVAAMISYGMVTVNLEGESGEKLQLAQGKTAAVSMNITSDLRASAPDNIPMWHFDEVKGMWIEEGKGIKAGNVYKGVVSHFSTWNFDVPANFVWIKLKLTDDNGNAMPYMPVKIFDPVTGAENGCFSDSAGNVRTWVPKSTPLQLDVYDQCQQSIYSKKIDPMEVDQDMGDILISAVKSPARVYGYVVDCSNTPINNGLVKLLFQGLIYHAALSDGEFSLNLDVCSAFGEPAKIIAEEYNSFTRSEPIDIEINPGSNNAGKIQVCRDELNPESPDPVEDPEEEDYIRYTFGDSVYVYNPVSDSLFYGGDGTGFSVAGYRNRENWVQANNAISISLPNKGSGTYINGTEPVIKHNGDVYLTVRESDTLIVKKFDYSPNAIEIEFNVLVRPDGSRSPDTIKRCKGKIRMRVPRP